MIEKIEHNDTIIAIIIKADFRKEGIAFFTPDHFSQQLGYMNRPKGYIIEPHVHHEVHRHVFRTQEVLFLKRGRVKVDLYGDDRSYINSRILEKGDVILLASGGHGIEVLEQSEIIEVKQGPYSGDRDKERFETSTKIK
jgi:uncharacterized protein YjlB